MRKGQKKAPNHSALFERQRGDKTL